MKENIENILVVEDDPDVRANITTLLEYSDYKVTEAENGLEALKVYNREVHNLIISDIMMPVMDGLELFQKLKSDLGCEMIPFIFLTAKADKEEYRRAMQLGSDDFITKPYSTDDLLNSVRVRLGKNALISKAQKSEKLKGEFLSQISHEVRTPVHTILSLSNLLKESTFSSEEHNSILNSIELAGKRITRTIDMMVYMSELKLEDYNLHPVSLDIFDDIIFMIVDNYRNLLEEKGINLNLSFPPEDTLVRADKNSLEIILDNLINNAIKFTNKGSVSIRYDDSNNTFLSLSIEDTGIGIDEQNLSEIFEPFTQAEQGYTRSFDGVGLGLSLVKKLADLNNIKIDLTSKKNIGTKVLLKVPKKIS